MNSTATLKGIADHCFFEVCKGVLGLCRGKPTLELVVSWSSRKQNREIEESILGLNCESIVPSYTFHWHFVLVITGLLYLATENRDDILSQKQVHTLANASSYAFLPHRSDVFAELQSSGQKFS